MMIAKTAVAVPAAVSTPAAEDAQYDGPPFASVLDEKTAARPCLAKPPRAAAGETSAESAKGDKQEASELTDGALLLFLQQILGGNRDMKKADFAEAPASASADPDGRSARLLPDGAALFTPAIVPTLSTDEQPEQATRLAASPLNALSAVRQAPVVTDNHDTSALQRQSAAVGEGEQQTGGSKAGEVITQPMPQPEAGLLSTKESSLSREGERAVVTPEFASPVPGIASRQAEVTNTPTLSALPQTLGTPAWQQSLGQQVAWFARGGVQRAELRLHPEELGSIHITLQLKDEQAQLHFVSASHQVRAAIEAAVPHLRTSLAESGIELEQSSIGAETTAGGNDSASSGQTPREKFAGQPAQNAAVVNEMTVETPSSTGGYNIGVNIFA